MARRKHKGKSQRRIKDWQTRYQAGEDADRLAKRGRKHTQRAVKLPPSRLEAPAEGLENLPKVEGLVTAVFRRGALVRIGGRELFCAIAKTFRAPEQASALAVGDIVTVALTQDHHTGGQLDTDKERADGMIVTRRLRETALSRPQPMSAKRIDEHKTEVFEKVIAANMDVLLIVASTCQPPLRPRLIERFLIVAERGELDPVLVVNKIDLAPAADEALGIFRELGLEVFPTSARTGEGLAPLRHRLAGRRSVLAGSSGAGKSTLINALVPGAEAATRSVRLKDQRGRHTTAAAAVYDLTSQPPAEGEAKAPAPGEAAEAPFGVGPGGILVDTPGVRELGFQLDLAELPWYFPEFEAPAQQCKFRNCTHTHEPDCAVIAAVQAGTIRRRRYDSYLRIRESLEQG